MTRDEYKTLHRLCRLASAVGYGSKAKGKGRKVAQKAAEELLRLIYEKHGAKVGAMVWGATYQKNGYVWTCLSRAVRFFAMKSACHFRRAGNKAVPF